MQEVFEKILEKMEELKKCGTKHYEDGKYIYTSPDYDHGTLNKTIEIVKQEAAEYNNGWIPCSERLPEENTTVIACFSNGVVTELVFYNGIFHGAYGYAERMIIAWQPLPQPYQPKGE